MNYIELNEIPNELYIENTETNNYIVLEKGEVIEINNMLINDENYYMLLNEIYEVMEDLKISLI